MDKNIKSINTNCHSLNKIFGCGEEGLDMVEKVIFLKNMYKNNGRWSKKYNECVNCRTTERKHQAKGMCWKCWGVEWLKNNKEKAKKTKAAWSKANSEKVKGYHQNWKKNNPEKAKEVYLKAGRKYRLKDPVKYRLYQKKWCKENPEKRKEYARKSSLKCHYGISIDEYNIMLKQQNNKCAICDSFVVGGGGGKNFYVDHNHITGKIRGLLCHKCNTSLGVFKDSMELLLKTVAYFKRFN